MWLWPSQWQELEVFLAKENPMDADDEPEDTENGPEHTENGPEDPKNGPEATEATEPKTPELKDLSDDQLQAKVDEMERQKVIFTWFWNKYLPYFAKDSFFGEQNRSTKLLTDKVTVAGKEWMMVTSATEALALVVFENNRDRWLYLFDKKANHDDYDFNKDKNVPKAKWTGSKGQQVYGGWADEGMQKWQYHRKTIKAHREADAENGHLVMISIRDMCASKLLKNTSPKSGNSSVGSEENAAVNLASVLDQVDVFGDENIFDEE